MSTRHVDLAVLGGGAAGLAAVREARRRGASALMVNAGPIGGDCTFTGCVPSKTLIEAARVGASFGEAFGRVRSVVDRIASSETADVLRAEGIEVIDEVGEITGPGRLRAGSTAVEAGGVVVAIGSRPAVPPIPGLDAVEPLTSDSFWSLGQAPTSLAVIGGGAIGCELSQALALLGVEVTLIEMAPRLLASEEPASSGVVARALDAAGVTVRTGVAVERVERRTDGAVLHLDDGSLVAAEQVLVATGRRSNADRSGLSAAGLDLDERGYVATSDDLKTTMARTYAAGDITGRVQLTHAADQMGRIAAGNSLRRLGRTRFVADRIPRVTFTDPEVASVGATEADAALRWPKARVVELPLDEHDRAIAADRTDGFIKLIAAPKPVIGHLGGGHLVGASIVAPRAGEMLGELTLALALKTFVGRVALTAHPYPTWSYGIQKAVGQFFTEIEGRTHRPVGG
ncbi:MAG: FAD-dependent oxidoreductase [Actinomycetota bacterium]